jgi:hypothetical protein
MDADIDDATRLGLYRSLLEIRLVEKRACDQFVQNLVKGTSHLALGQEAVAAGFAVAMRLEEVSRTGRLYTVEENPRLWCWGAEIASIAAEECFYDLDGPIVRITTPHVPLPAADALEDHAVPSVERIVDTVRRTAG